MRTIGLILLGSLFVAGTACDQRDAIDGGDDLLAGDSDDDAADEPDPADPGDDTSVPEPDDDEPEGEVCTAGETRSCDGGAIQYCDYLHHDSGYIYADWGPCIAEAFCTPGETFDCGYCDDPDDFMCEACGDMTGSCELVDGVPGYTADSCACDTPLVLSFDGAPVQMLQTPMATFDISDAGGCISTDWPAASTPWLALDLDRNGNIDTGRELFGSGTRLAAGQRASHGFVALSELDDNRDGKIDGADARFSELVLWADHDADKQASFGELQPLAMRGILSLDLGYTVDPRCDDRGNCEGQRAPFTYLATGGEVREGEVVDIYLACQ